MWKSNELGSKTVAVAARRLCSTGSGDHATEIPCSGLSAVPTASRVRPSQPVVSKLGPTMPRRQ
jgi:hypothetical protein